MSMINVILRNYVECRICLVLNKIMIPGSWNLQISSYTAPRRHICEIGVKKHKILNKTSQTKVPPRRSITRYKDGKLGKPIFSFIKNAISRRKDDFTFNRNALWDTYAYSI